MDPTWLRLKTVTQAGLARIPLGGAKKSVSPSPSSRRISRSRLPYHLTSAWRWIWSKMFRNDDWHRHMEKAGLMPALVGADLHLLSKDDKATPKVLVLVVPREDQKAVVLMQSFFKSLRAHSYDPSTDQLTFTDWNLAVNIRSLNTYDKIVLEDPTRLFRRGERLTTTALFYEREAQPQDMRPGLFGGLCKGLPRSMADIRNVCSVMLKRGNGTPMYQRFERPGCPPVRGIIARYQEAEIGPWRFERSVLKLENYNVWAGNCQW